MMSQKHKHWMEMQKISIYVNQIIHILLKRFHMCQRSNIQEMCLNCNIEEMRVWDVTSVKFVSEM